jgi:hypothetical protein
VGKKPAPLQPKPQTEEAEINRYNPKPPLQKIKNNSQDWPSSLEEFLLDPNFESCW